MGELVVEEQVGLEGSEHLGFLHSPQEEGLVHGETPGAQGSHDPLVGRGPAGGGDGDAQTRDVGRVATHPLRFQRLDAPEFAEEAQQGPGIQGRVPLLLLLLPERVQTTRLVDLLRGVVGQDPVEVEGDPQAGIVGVVLQPVVCQNLSGRDAQPHRFPDILGMGGQEQARPEGFHVAPGGSALGEHGPLDVQAVPGDGPEHARTGVRVVAGEQDHFHGAVFPGLVEGKEPVDEGKGDSRPEKHVFAFPLVRPVGLLALLAEDAVGFRQVEERRRGHGHDELAVEIVHGTNLATPVRQTYS